MARISKAFMCNDLDAKSEWPISPKRVDYVMSIINKRNIYRSNMFINLNLTPDKKSKQWWSKFAVDKTWRSFHFYQHHLIRQCLNHLANHPNDMKLLVGDYSEVLPRYQRISNECKWKPND